MGEKLLASLIPDNIKTLNFTLKQQDLELLEKKIYSGKLNPENLKFWWAVVQKISD